uniref:DnaJ homolog subfamily C member 2 n=1 Tax=Meloidogyne floridensis TaxID=298350 RepID=A0A915P847_9BILA
MAIAIYGFLSRRRKVEPAGISYEFSQVKDKLTLGLSTWPILKNAVKPIQIGEETEDSSFEWMDEETEKYKKYLSRLDPNDAKDQDHYKILGLTKLRCEATAAQIRTAYRQKVLKYHPDKGNAGDGLRSESVFACIQKAYEQLGVSEEKRRAFDSVDPTFDENIPDNSDVNSTNFFRVLGPVFERNSRFSVNQPVPLLGDENSDRSHVEHFYDFWYNWKSWREFSYLDAEDKQRGEDRWERREIEKQNKAEREKRRKKDLKRISTLVEMAYSVDPRIAKQQKKKLLSNQRKQLRDLSSNKNYWLDNSLAAENPEQVFAISEQIERLCLSAEVDDLVNLCERLKDVCVYDDALRILRECSNPESSNNSKQSNNGMPKNSAQTNDAKTNSSSTNAWTHTELQLLVKAVNLFPPGTQERWKQVSGYINEHSGEGNKRSEKDVKQLKSGQLPPSNSTTVPINKNIQHQQITTTDTPINNTNNNQNNEQQNNVNKNTEDEWNAEQQRQFEKALKEIPSSDAERWDKIAAAVDGKTKKQCVRRYKKLAEMVKNAKTEAAK